MGTQNRYSEEVREWTVRMMSEHRREYRSQWSTIKSISSKISCTAKTLKRWCAVGTRCRQPSGA